MIIAKAPLRVSLFGGGSDIPAYYLKHPGATISMAIDKYVYVAVMQTPHDHVKVSYSRQELVPTFAEVDNDIVREALRYFGINKNIEITTFADIPTIGTGLGGSSAFTCALVAALGEYIGVSFGPYDIAEISCQIEINMCKWNIGKQDQYASAFGGMNFIQYGCYNEHDWIDDFVEDKISVTNMKSGDIDYYCLLIPTEFTRHASEIIDTIDFNKQENAIYEMADIAYQLKDKSPSLNLYCDNLKKSWILKRNLSASISNPEIDEMLRRCLDNGAGACKLLGAGGGGFMLALTEEKEKLKKIFPDRVCLDYKIARNGAQVVYRD